MIAVVEKYEWNIMKNISLNDNERRECDWKDKTSKHVDVLKNMGKKKQRKKEHQKMFVEMI